MNSISRTNQFNMATTTIDEENNRRVANQAAKALGYNCMKTEQIEVVANVLSRDVFSSWWLESRRYVSTNTHDAVFSIDV